MNEERTNTLSTADLAGRDTAQNEGQREANKMSQGDGGSMPAHDSAIATKTREESLKAQSHPDNGDNHQEALPLIPDNVATGFRDRWSTIQTNFVDEPKDAVREADGLVAEVIQRVAQRFAEERQKLEGQWSSGGDVSTEDLRQALQHYRSFFQRLLSA
jgi:hypothetical protein